MAVSEDVRRRLAQWCATRVPSTERGERRVAYTIHGDEVTIVERRPPTFPELRSAWSTTPVARLRHRDGTWTLDRPDGAGGWLPAGAGDEPIDLLDRLPS